MSQTAILRGLRELFLTVPGIQVVYMGEPKALQELPMIYTLPEDISHNRTGGTARESVFTASHTLCVAWQDPEAADLAIVALADAVLTALDANPRLSGAVRGALTWSSGDYDWKVIGGREVRTFEFRTEARELGAYA